MKTRTNKLRGALPLLAFLILNHQFLTLLCAQNLLVNGDFSSGNTGFTSSYAYIASGQSATVDTYGIRTSSQDFNPGYNAFADHTTGTGNMMLVDGSSAANAVVWSETISVTPNSSYLFSGWATASDSANVATLRFLINGVQVGTDTTLTTIAGQWQQFFAGWNSGASTTATVSVVDETLIAEGNDFALDDFSFTPTPSPSFTGTAFTYQGRLNNGTNPANGSYDLSFSLFATNLTGVPVAGPVTNSAVAVNNGIFTTTIDFGASAFAGNSAWLEIGVRTNGGTNFTTLIPRQQLTPTPYAITAENLAAVAQYNSIVPGNYATVGGGQYNAATFIGGTVGGGQYNTNNSDGGTVGGGYENFINGNGADATIGGGVYNSATNFYSTVGGGNHNAAGGVFSTVGGGANNLASGYGATVSGGYGNTAAGVYSFAGGFFANALYEGCFVWNDDNGRSFSSTANNQFAVQADGGVLLAANVQIGTNTDDYRYLEMGGGNASGFLFGSYLSPIIGGDGLTLAYNYYADAAGNDHFANNSGQTSRITVGYGSISMAIGDVATAPDDFRLYANETGVEVYGTFNNNSDRNAKQDFAPVSSSQILDRVLQLPVSEWSYKVDARTRHIGPMAQDFYSIFNLGTDEKHIAPIDEGGVALAAIQGLNQKVESLKNELKLRDAENAELNQRLETLENAVLTHKPKQ